jgi:predicted RNA-binding protein YlxR (DUF448 family)
MCIGCRRRSQQRSLVRFTVAGGMVVVDADQRLPGRGAYVCRRLQCATRVLSDGRPLVHALRTTRDRVIVDTEALLQDWKANRRDDAAGSAPPNGTTVAGHTHNAVRAQVPGAPDR